MSIHTILSQMEEEFDKKFSSIEVYYNERSQFYGVIIPEDIHENDEYTLNDIKKFMRSFATRVVEEVGKELIGEDEEENLLTKEGNISTQGFANMHKNSLRASQRAKLQKMKI